MATFYVSSVDGSDSDDGSTWALAKQTVAGALAAATSDGDIIYVDSDHDYSSGAAIAWDVATAGHKISIISVDRNGSSTTGHNGHLAGARETVGVNSAAFAIGAVRAGTLYVEGMEIYGASGASTNQVTVGQPSGTTGSAYTFVDCVFATPGTSGNSYMMFGTVGGSRLPVRITLRDCVLILKSSTTSQAVQINHSICEFSGITIQFSGANKPPSLFGGTAVGQSFIQVTCSDLSGYDASGGVYVTAPHGRWVFSKCKLSATPSTTPSSFPSGEGGTVTYVRCDSGDTTISFRHYSRLGSLVESSSVYASSGAQHDATPVSWQIVTTSLASEHDPFIVPLIMKWQTSTSSQTLTLEIVHDSATDLHDRNCWMEYDYVSDASFPLGTRGSTRNAEPFDGTAVDLAAGAATWTGTGGFSNENKQKLSATYTPAEKSEQVAQLYVGIASKTLYLDPKRRVA